MAVLHKQTAGAVDSESPNLEEFREIEGRVMQDNMSIGTDPQQLAAASPLTLAVRLSSRWMD
jgi:hypothetical protein